MSLQRLFNDSFFRSPSIFSNEFHSLFNDLDRLAGSAGSFSDGSNVASSFAPRVKLTEHGNEYKLEAEVAGFPKEALSIEFPDTRVLRLSGKYEQETRQTPSQEKSAGDGIGKTGQTTEVATTAADTEKQVAGSAGGGGNRVWHNERISRSFTRSIGLPGPINTDAVKASLDHGVLSIILPKLDKAESSKRVQIQ